MYESYMDKFFKKVNNSYVTKYTDSTDFERPTKIAAVTSKYGKHCLFKNPDNIEYQENPNIEFIYQDPKLKFRRTDKYDVAKRFQGIAKNHHCIEISDYKTKQSSQTENDRSYNNYDKNRGDQNQKLETPSSKSLLRNKLFPRLSNIFKRPYLHLKQMPSIEENHQIVLNDKKLCVGCERRRVKKLRKTKRRFDQPVYAVEGNLQTPFQPKQIQNVSLQHKYNKNQCSSTPTSITSCFASFRDPLNKKAITNKKFRGKNYEIFCSQNNYVECPDYKQHKNLQYPSKYMKPTTQPLINSCCQANCGSVKSIGSNVDPSSSSSFWNFVAEKLKTKNKTKSQSPEECACVPLPRCTLSSCDKLNSIREERSDTNFTNSPQSPNRQMSPTKLLKPNIKQGGPIKFSNQDAKATVLAKNKTSRNCQCSDQQQDIDSQEADGTCQRPHDIVTKSLADKYNGQILCIHNPPCILINGCLNLPAPKQSIFSNIWRVTQSKKSSESRKTKLSNEIFDQACQYEPPYALQECLPEFQTEKIIQSICNHNPPCEVVRGCYKPKFDPKLKDSCVHVPMCQKYPECLLKKVSVDGETQCSHNPKCDERPLCSTKLMVLTAKEDMSTQVKPRSRMVCRHDPPCLMIPKCIARVICNEAVPYDAIPDCVHKPCCELIPACCRKAAKEMVSVSSQYPKAPCRIV